MKKNYEDYNCVFCEATENLKSFKTVHVCEECIEYAKVVEPEKKEEK